MSIKGLLNTTSIKAFGKSALMVAERNAPAIAAGLAIAGLFAAVVATAKAAPACKESLEQAHIKKNEKALSERMDSENFSDATPIEELTFSEKFPIYVKHFGKAFIITILSGACMVTSVWFGNKQKAALTMLLTAAESKLIDIEGAAKTVVGEKKFDEIKGAIIDKKIADNPPNPQSGFIAKTGNGDTLCCEPIFGTYYESDIAAVKTAYADFYDLYVHTGQVYMEDLYNFLRIPKSFLPKIADNLGYMLDADEGIEHKPEYTPRSVPVQINGIDRVCYVMDMTLPKTYDQLLSEAHAKNQFRSWK